jgi:hypothetical protein
MPVRISWQDGQLALARSMKQLIETVETLRLRGIGFRSLTEALDTTTAQGRLVFHMFGALAEFERSLIRERTRAGLAAARRAGRTGEARMMQQTMLEAYRFQAPRSLDAPPISEPPGKFPAELRPQHRRESGVPVRC